MVVTYLKETGVDKRTGQMRYKVAYSLRATGVGPVKRASAEGPKAA
jgi:hypothetical protein